MSASIILGNALAGLGKGKAMVAQHNMDQEAAMARSAEEERRQIALENLRSSNTREERIQTADLDDRNSARQTARATSADLIKLDKGAKIDAAQDERRANIDAEKDKRRYSYDVKLAQVTSNLRMSESAADRRLADELERGRAAGEIEDVTIDGKTGERVVVYKDGSIKRTGVTATARETAPPSSGRASTPSTLDAARGLGGSRPAQQQRPEVRYDGNGNAYVLGANGQPQRAPQYDRK